MPGNFLFYALLALSIGIMGCAKSFNPDIERGSTYHFKEGHPEVRFSAIGLIDEEGNPHINISADIVYGSLIYNQENDILVSNIATEVQIIDQENDQVVDSKQYTLAIEKEDPNIVYSQDIHTFQRSISVKPGDYKVEFTLTDLSSDKRISSSAQTFIPDPKRDVSSLTNILMMGKNLEDENPRWSPITTYDVPGRVDSLKFIFQVTNNDSDEPLMVNSRLLRFKSDTSYARLMHFNSYSPSSIQYKGIEYDKEEVIQTTQRKLIETGNVLIQFTFGQQKRGNYRFEVQTDRTSGDEMFKARDFGVKSTNYPSIQSPRELAQPLIYLMNEGEYEEMMKINDSDSLKQAVDRFWLRHIGNKNKTKGVIKKFYSRVEEANKHFSNFKEGWKTDPGLVYILFGPPWYVNHRLDEMYWSYSYNRSNPERNFFFFQPRLQSEYFLLLRSRAYFSIQYQQVQLWLSGYILQRNL